MVMKPDLYDYMKTKSVAARKIFVLSFVFLPRSRVCFRLLLLCMLDVLGRGVLRPTANRRRGETNNERKRIRRNHGKGSEERHNSRLRWIRFAISNIRYILQGHIIDHSVSTICVIPGRVITWRHIVWSASVPFVIPFLFRNARSY